MINIDRVESEIELAHISPDGFVTGDFYVIMYFSGNYLCISYISVIVLCFVWLVVRCTSFDILITSENSRPFICVLTAEKLGAAPFLFVNDDAAWRGWFREIWTNSEVADKRSFATQTWKAGLFDLYYVPFHVCRSFVPTCCFQLIWMKN